MEFQEYSDYYPQQEHQQFPEAEETEEYFHQEEVAAAVSQPSKPTYGYRSSYPSSSAQSGPMKSNVPPMPKPRFPITPTYRPTTPSNVTPISCKWHNVVNCEECMNLPSQTHHCQALVAICQDCGQQHPVIADACQSSCKSINMPVSDGLLENQPVKVLRDSGCSTVVVRRSLVSEDKLTGREERCVLIDGTVRRTPVAEIFIVTP